MFDGQHVTLLQTESLIPQLHKHRSQTLQAGSEPTSPAPLFCPINHVHHRPAPSARPRPSRRAPSSRVLRAPRAALAERGPAAMPLARDLLHPSLEEEKRKHKKKRLVQSPNSYFMDVKCPGCYKITTVFSHAQTVVLCVGCSTILCQPTGGKARLTEGCSFRRKQH
ncbi:ribosomal protein eS27-like [Excalfactoria chinensis]|uniref:ribosomal protein eS27-like n=2 Tax=Neognathae TaxID=8825 RepID=UPI003B3B0EC3